MSHKKHKKGERVNLKKTLLKRQESQIQKQWKNVLNAIDFVTGSYYVPKKLQS